MICKNCLKQISDDSLFCNFCGTKTRVNPICPKCSEKLAEGSLFCNKCGTKLDGNAAKTPTSFDEIEEEVVMPDFDEFEEDIAMPDFDELDEDIVMPDFDELDEDIVMPDFDELEEDIAMPDFDELDSPDGLDEFEGDPVVIEQDFSIYEDKTIHWDTPPDKTKINSFTVKKKAGLTNIIIPNGITEIGDSTFSEWTSLKKVAIPEGVKKIEEYAFRMCQNLNDINIPDSVTEIRSGAFSGCESLGSIFIPGSVKLFGSHVFYNCPNLTIYCESGSAAEKAAINEWVNFRLTDRSPYTPEASAKPAKPSLKGRMCGTHCFNAKKNIYNGHEYGGWYYDMYFDKYNGCRLVRFDEDNINAIEYLWSDENINVDEGDNRNTYVQVNRCGVFAFVGPTIFWFDHLGVLKERVEVGSLFPELAAKIKKEKKEWKDSYYNKYSCNPFSSIWVYGDTLYFITKYDSDKGMIYKYSFSIRNTETFKISKPRNIRFFQLSRLTGDERYLLFSMDGDTNRIFDTLTHAVNKTNAYYIDFESKRCYYNADEKPGFTPEGFRNYTINKDLFDTADGKIINGTYVGGFYNNNFIFTGNGFYGFRYGHVAQFSHKNDNYYNLYKVSANNWQYLDAGSRGGIEELNIQGTYLCFDSGTRVKLDGSRMDKYWFGHSAGYHSLYKSEEVFRKYLLQETDDYDWPDMLIDI